jgi:hypothetical protein
MMKIFIVINVEIHVLDDYKNKKYLFNDIKMDFCFKHFKNTINIIINPD